MGSAPNRAAGPILLAVDGSPDSDLARRAAADLAGHLKVELHVVHCWQPLVPAFGPAGAPSIDVELVYRPAQELLAAEVAELRQQGAQVAGQQLLLGRAAEQIPDLATTLGAQLIVVGSRGMGAVKRLVLGSVSEGVVHAASTPVLVLRGDGHAWPPDEVLVGDDGSAHSRRAAECAAAIAGATGARLTIATVIPSEWREASSPAAARRARDLQADAEKMTQQLATQLSVEFGLAVRTELLVGVPADELIKEASSSPVQCMIALGSRGRGAIDRLIMGSVSTRVLHQAPGAVLIAHTAS